ncbi:MAG: DUF6515 family protein [Candidatus Omnitrophota bacterium]
MLSKVNLKSSILLMGVLAVLFQAGESYAWDNGRRDRFDHRPRLDRYRDHPRFGVKINLVPDIYMPIVVGSGRYYYYDGLYYLWDGGVYVLVPPPVGAIVPSIPSDYRPVMINRTIYYFDSGVYYIRSRHGYEVVYPPMVHTISGPMVVTKTGPSYVQASNQTKVAEGAGLGGVIGAIIGGVIGHQQKGHHELGGALIGGAAGAAAGGILGAQIPHENAVVASTAVASLTGSAVVPAPEVISPAAAVVQEPFDQVVTVNIPDNHGGFVPVVIKRSGNGFVGPQGEFYPEFPKVSQLQTIYVK